MKEAYGQRSAGLMTKDLGMAVEYKRYPMPHSACPVRAAHRNAPAVSALPAALSAVASLRCCAAFFLAACMRTFGDSRLMRQAPLICAVSTLSPSSRRRS